VDSRTEIRDFLTTRRARITPERAGLPAYGGNRRVTGLRREEVALLAGVSVDYYTRRPGVQRLLDAMTPAPAYVRNGRWNSSPTPACDSTPIPPKPAPSPMRR
jgi:hypothetical protein